MMITRNEIEQILIESISELYERDGDLLKHDVSERAITHKLAEYLQRRIPNLDVDCEYNRNLELGNRAPKAIQLLNDEMDKHIKINSVADLLSISTFPDIIVHRRTINAENLLIVEVKKMNSPISSDHDYRKLKAFTENNERNSYHFKYGVFIRLNTGKDWESKPNLEWFIEGHKEIL